MWSYMHYLIVSIELGGGGGESLHSSAFLPGRSPRTSFHASVHPSELFPAVPVDLPYSWVNSTSLWSPLLRAESTFVRHATCPNTKTAKQTSMDKAESGPEFSSIEELLVWQKVIVVILHDCSKALGTKSINTLIQVTIRCQCLSRIP